MRLGVLIPLAIFMLLCGVFLLRLLNPEPLNTVPSALIGKPVPALNLSPVETIDTPFLNSDVIGASDVLVVNVWASWCAPCRIEHLQIQALSKQDGVTVAGINYKDEPDNAARFLRELGNPYHFIGADRLGLVSVEFGVYGVPETFLIDRAGIIRAKYIGEITPDILHEDVLPMIETIRSRE